MAKLDPLEIARMTSLLTSVYGEMDRGITLIMIKRLMEGAPELPAEVDTWRAEKLLQAGRFTRDAKRTIQKMGGIIPAYLDRVLYQAWRSGYGLDGMTVWDPDGPVGILGSAEPAARRSYLQAKLRENALDQLNLVNTSMLRSGQQKYIDILNDATDRVLAREVSPYIAIQEASQQLLDEGLTGFIDRAGRKWKVETATDMIVRKAANDAGNQAVFARLEEEGTDLVLVSSHRGARPLCAMDQGQVFSIRGYEGVVKDGHGNNVKVRSWASSTYGEPAGILGINCRHHIAPFIAGKSLNLQEIPDKDENAKQYKLEQEQRRQERDLRYHKRKRDIAHEVGDREEELKQKRIIRAKGKKLQAFVDKNELTRNQVRERNKVKSKPNYGLAQTHSKYSIESRNPADGTPGGVYTGYGKLSKRQQSLDRLLSTPGRLESFGKRDVSLKDLSTLTAHNSCEYAVFTKGAERIVVRGSASNAMVAEKELLRLANEGYRFSGHTHPGVGRVVRLASQGDRNVLNLFKQEQSVVYDSVGGFTVFAREERNEVRYDR